jgi:hypothetical protein
MVLEIQWNSAFRNFLFSDIYLANELSMGGINTPNMEF